MIVTPRALAKVPLLMTSNNNDALQSNKTTAAHHTKQHLYKRVLWHRCENDHCAEDLSFTTIGIDFNNGANITL